MSKTLTAAVVLQLVDEGKVDLDAPAARYLPAYSLDRRITVRMLMDHRSSLPDFFGNAKIDRALQGDKDATWTAARAWKYVPKVRPKPGTIYDYSNTNYLLLGELVEHVTNNPLATEVRTRLLDPLELETAWYQAAEEPKANGARGYRLTRTASGSLLKPVAARSDVMPFRSVVTAAGGAGSIAGTATDAARWMQAWGSGSLLSRATYREMLRDAKYTRAMHAIVTYGLGVQLISIQGQQTLGHSGRYLGFQNAVRYLPGPGISIADPHQPEHLRPRRADAQARQDRRAGQGDDVAVRGCHTPPPGGRAVAMPAASAWRDGRPDRHLGLAVPRLARAVLSEAPGPASVARALRDGLRHRRVERRVLPAAGAPDLRGMGRPDSARTSPWRSRRAAT